MTTQPDETRIFEVNCAALDRWPGGRCRTGQLQRALPGISKKMLVQTLRDMEMRGLLARHVYTVVPPKVERWMNWKQTAL